jgi:hypothetical protein
MERSIPTDEVVLFHHSSFTDNNINQYIIIVEFFKNIDNNFKVQRFSHSALGRVNFITLNKNAGIN